MTYSKYSKIWLFVFSILFAGGTFVACGIDQVEPGPSLYETLTGVSEARIFLEAIDVAGFDDDLKNGQALTVFVPTNEAFENFLADNNFADLAAVPIENLRNLLRYHILPLGIDLGSLSSNYTLTAASNSPNGGLLALLVENPDGSSPTILNNSAQVLNQDRPSGISYYNIINQVLSMPTVLNILQDNEIFSGFSNGISQSSELLDSLSNNGPYTVLAATNTDLEETLMQRYGVSDLASLETLRLDSLMKYHVLKGNYTADNFQNAFDNNYPTLVPEENVKVSGFTIIFANDSVQLVLANIQATNGVVHIMDKMLDR